MRLSEGANERVETRNWIGIAIAKEDLLDATFVPVECARAIGCNRVHGRTGDSHQAYRLVNVFLADKVA